jgi:signal transduction histidine kinase
VKTTGGATDARFIGPAGPTGTLPRGWRTPRWLESWPSVAENPATVMATERSLANARAFTALAALVAVYLDPAEPSRFPAIAYGILWAYISFSLLVLAAVRHKVPSTGARIAIHVVDVTMPCLLILFAEGPSSPFFVMLPLALLAAAYRWGYVATVLTGTVGMIVLVTSAVFARYAIGPLALHPEPLDPSRFLLRAMYLIVLTVMIGYLAERGRRLHAESRLVADMLGLVRSQVGVRELLARLGERLLRLYAARGLALAANDEFTGRAALWQLDADGLRSAALKPADRDLYLEPRPEPCWQSARGSGEPVGGRLDCKSFIACDVRLGESISGRLFVLDPHGAPLPADRLQLLARLAAYVTPAVYNAYLLHRLRSRAVAGERARLGRDLHDGLVQSLLGLELQVESYRRQESPGSPQEQHLAKIRDDLRGCVDDVRTLMGKLQESNLTPRNVTSAIRRMATRLHREAGIAVSVEGFPTVVNCSPRGARELAQIVREALVNVRKHSGATHVRIAYSDDVSSPRLTIADDGRGFPCQQTLAGAALEECECAPAMLLARVRMLGGRLTVASPPGQGATLVVEWPGTGESHG